MPTYNCAEYISESILSVLSQTHQNWELIISDDCSTDVTFEVIKQFSDRRIKYIRSTKNNGVASARNRALEVATGSWIAFLDSDDLWMPEKLEKQISFMELNNAHFSCTAYSQIDANGNSLNIGIIPPKIIDYKKCLRLSNPIGNSTVMYNQNILGKFIIPEIKKRNDFALWLQILKKTDCYGMDEFLSQYRKGRPGSISTNKLKLIRYHWQLYHDIERHSSLRSLYEIGCFAIVKGMGLGIKKSKLVK